MIDSLTLSVRPFKVLPPPSQQQQQQPSHMSNFIPPKMGVPPLSGPPPQHSQQQQQQFNPIQPRGVLPFQQQQQQMRKPMPNAGMGGPMYADARGGGYNQPMSSGLDFSAPPPGWATPGHGPQQQPPPRILPPGQQQQQVPPGLVHHQMGSVGQQQGSFGGPLSQSGGAGYQFGGVGAPQLTGPPPQIHLQGDNRYSELFSYSPISHFSGAPFRQ